MENHFFRLRAFSSDRSAVIWTAIAVIVLLAALLGLMEATAAGSRLMHLATELAIGGGRVQGQMIP